MTTTIDPPTRRANPEVAATRTATPGEQTPRSTIRRRPKAVVAWVVVGVVAILLAILIVEDPIAHLWYEARQGQLGSEGGTTGAIRDGRQVGVIVIDYPATSDGTAASTERLFVVQGDGTSELRGGPGHQPETPLPGQRGNVVVFGHRHDWGAPFARLDTLAAGDQIEAQSVNATQAVVYRVTSTRTVAAGASALLDPTDDYRLTLVTAAGGRRSDGWLVVTAVSGTPKPGSASHLAMGGPRREPVFINGAFASLVLAVALGGLIIAGLRRRARITTIWIMLAPLIAAGLLALVLELDLFWVPLA